MPLLPVAKFASAGIAAAIVLAGGYGDHAGRPAHPSRAGYGQHAWVGWHSVSAPSAERVTSRASRLVLLSVRVIDRTGQLVKPLDMQFQDIATGINIDLGQGTSRSVRPGRYNVAAWIGTGSGSAQTFTLDDQIVNVTGSLTITLDARQGRLFQLRLDAPGAVEELLELAPIVHGNWAFNPGPGAATESVHSVYVVPLAARGVTFYAYSVWEKSGNTLANPSPFRYDIINVYKGGIPAHPSFTVRRSSLAKINITVRATDQGQQATLFLQPTSAGGQSLPLDAGTTLGATPARLVAYRSPGFVWQPIMDAQGPHGEIRDFVLDMAPYGRGDYRETYFTAVLSPQQFGLFGDVTGQRMQLSIVGFLLGDPAHPNSTDQGSGLTTSFRLFLGSRLLASSHGGNLNVHIPAATHWYNLQLDTTRTAGATLSTQLHVRWHFRAHGTTGGLDWTPTIYIMRLQPGGLDLSNTAARGVTTPVALRVYDDLVANPLRMSAVSAQESVNDGQTWRNVTVRVVGDRYVLSVKNPGQAGFVSLRLSIRDSSGISEQLTVLHAYGVR